MLQKSSSSASSEASETCQSVSECSSPTTVSTLHHSETNLQLKVGIQRPSGTEPDGHSDKCWEYPDFTADIKLVERFGGVRSPFVLQDVNDFLLYIHNMLHPPQSSLAQSEEVSSCTELQKSVCFCLFNWWSPTDLSELLSAFVPEFHFTMPSSNRGRGAWTVSIMRQSKYPRLICHPTACMSDCLPFQLINSFHSHLKAAGM